MSYERFTNTYHRHQHAPRTSGQAFKDADYASPLQVYKSRRKRLIGDILICLALIGGLLLLAYF